MARLLYERDWDKQRIVDLFAVIDWLMKLPDELNRRLWRKIESLERGRSMPHVTSVERFGVEKGIQLGIAQGNDAPL